MTDLKDLEVLSRRTIGGLEIAPASEQEPYINLMVYGDPGVGKTLLSGTAADVPDMSPVLILDIEGGTLTLREKYPDVDVVRLKTWKDMQKVYDDLYDGKAPYKTVVIDSITECQKFSMAQIMIEMVKAAPDRDPDVPSQREWGKSIEQIRRTIRGFRDLPMHTIFTALAIHERDERIGRLVNRVSLPGKLSGEASGFVDILGYMYMTTKDGANKRSISFTQTQTTIAKDRSNKLPMAMEEPTMLDIHTHIFEGATNAS
jgi:phage nucleotide-binding protein